MKQILVPTTEEATSNTFALGQDGAALTIISNGYQEEEYARLQLFDPIKDDWFDVVNAGNNYQLSVTSNFINIVDDWATYRLFKTATASAVGISLIQFRNAQGR